MRVLLAALLMTAGMPAFAQEQATFVQQPRCWLGGTEHSPGATIRAGNAVMVCTPEFTWAPTEDWAAGCLHGGRFYSVGDIRQDFAQQRTPSECQPDGTWGRVAAAD